MPAELDEVTRRMMQLEIEEAALTKEKDKASQERLEHLRQELADLKEQSGAMRAQWEAEKQAIGKIRELREEIEQVKRQIEQAERAYDLNRAAELRHGRLPALESRLKADETQLSEKQAGKRLLREEVTEDEIAEIVSRWTGIPVTRLVEGERDKLPLTRFSINASWARTKPCIWWPMQSFVRALASRIHAGLLARLSS